VRSYQSDPLSKQQPIMCAVHHQPSHPASIDIILTVPSTPLQFLLRPFWFLSESAPSELPPLASATSRPVLFHHPVPAGLWRICHCQETGCSQDTIRYSGLHNGPSSVGRSPTADVLYLLVSSSTTGHLWVASVIGEHGICWANL
jgi:hypothetical protein